MKAKLTSLTIFLISIVMYDFNIVYFMLLVIIGIFFKWKSRLDKKWITLEILFGTIFFVLTKIFNFYFDFKTISTSIDNLFKISLKDKLIDYLKNTHDQNVFGFLKLLIFNIKDQDNLSIYNQLSKLSIVHLIVIGGFHINLLCCLIVKIKYVGKYLSIIVCLIFCYFTNFSPSMLRTLFVLVFSLNKNTKKLNYNLTILSLILINFNYIFNIGLIMSFLGVRAIKVASNININNVFLKGCLTSFIALLYLTPFVAIFSNKQSLWAIFISSLFSPIFEFTFLISIIFCWIPWLSFLFTDFIEFFDLMISSINQINIYFDISFFKKEEITITYFAFLECVIFLVIKRTRKDVIWNIKQNLKL